MTTENNLGGFIQKAQQMQEKVKKLQEELAKATVVGESGGGMVRITMNGRHDVTNVEIDPAIMGEKKEIIEDLVAAAMNDAVRRAEDQQEETMSTLATEFSFPLEFKLPFN